MTLYEAELEETVALLVLEGVEPRRAKAIAFLCVLTVMYGDGDAIAGSMLHQLLLTPANNDGITALYNSLSKVKKQHVSIYDMLILLDLLGGKYETCKALSKATSSNILPLLKIARKELSEESP